MVENDHLTKLTNMLLSRKKWWWHRLAFSKEAHPEEEQTFWLSSSESREEQRRSLFFSIFGTQIGEAKVGNWEPSKLFFSSLSSMLVSFDLPPIVYPLDTSCIDYFLNREVLKMASWEFSGSKCKTTRKMYVWQCWKQCVLCLREDHYLLFKQW